MKIKKDYSEFLGCWIDAAVPRTKYGICEILTGIAAALGTKYDQLTHEPKDLAPEDRDYWLEAVTREVDELINSILNPQGFLAIWDCGDYVILHESEYFSDRKDYLTANN